MSNVGATCAICYESHRISQFLILPCGHAHCTTCTEKLVGNSRTFNCPSCRSKFPKTAPHKICLDIVDSKTFFATDVIDKVNQMDANSKLNTVEKAVEKITKASKIVKHDEELSRRLLEAIERFKDLVPGFQRAEKAETELYALRRTLEEKEGILATRARRTQALESEVDKLQKKLKAKEDELKLSEGKWKTVDRNWDTRLRKAEEERDKALELAEKATSEFVQLKEDNAKLEKSFEEVNNTNKIHKRQLDYYLSKNSAQSQELKELKEQCIALQSKLFKPEQEQGRLHSELVEGESLAITMNEFPSSDSLRLNDSIELDREGMPPSQFGSSWKSINTISSTKSKPLKRPLSSSRDGLFAIKVDAKGKPLAPVQTGPRAIKRVRI